MTLCITVIFSGCKKEDEVPYSNAPVIEFLSVTPSSAKEYSDIIKFQIKYKDHDGDLGDNDPNVTNLFVKDLRNSVEYKFRTKQLSPNNATIAIEGNLNIELPPTAITNGADSESTTFEIYVKDRAGNISNTVTSTVVLITK